VIAKEAVMPEARDVIKAAKQGDVASLGRFLDEQSELLNSRDKDGATALHHAAWKGHAEVATLLLERGADLTLQNEGNTHWGGTALHAAAHGNNRGVAEILIRHGADVNLRSCNGRTPLEETTIHNATAVARLLREHGAVG
jgi:ankyrin repeat protein